MRQVAFVTLLLAWTVQARGATYVALGDSITSGTNAVTGVVFSDYSWAVGRKLERTFVKALGDRVDAVYSLAIPGAVSAILKAQAVLAENLKPDYVTIEIGANDYGWGLGHRVAPDVRWVVERLSRGEKKPKIFVGMIPDLEWLYKLGRGRRLCQLTHWLAPFFLKASDERRAEISRDIVASNEAILALADEFPNVFVVDTLDGVTLEPEDVSTVDCIHPSARGQQRIADAFIQVLEQSE
ncbi:MAG: SGNH/GDSL hydrolase family protein [Deltaproteobacteria bacterium]|nr:SGNH/GDSL hydrolase family protein [Deltaproteobacteria bacterium]